jgi:hypothetical protein
MNTKANNKITEHPTFHIILSFLTVSTGALEAYIVYSQGIYALLSLVIAGLLLILGSWLILSLINKFGNKRSKQIPDDIKAPENIKQKEIKEPIVKYVKYDVFRWKVSNLNNKYNVAKSPICLICCIPIDFYQNEWDGTTYKCAKCNTNYNENYNIPQIRKALILELQTHGFNRIKNIYCYDSREI